MSATAEQHLGDRLAALIDGELGHESRERVLAHLATCHNCKAEADAQRRVKSVFADTAPPGPSDGLLARLQMLPAGGDDRTSADPAGPEGPAGSGWGFSYLPSGSVLAPQRGFRIHEADRAAAARRASRRFAFAAAGAFSLAAVAIGGALNTSSSGGSSVSAAGGPSASPLRTAATGVDHRTERRGSGGLTAQGERAVQPPLTPTGNGAAIAPTGGHYLPLLGSAAMLHPPLIRSAYPAERGMRLTPAPVYTRPPQTPEPTPAATPMGSTPNR
ncbi:zf-HC2 domain-containing protein [Streptomyces gobiensis]|uniref:zf-HC2 domain-containing protein n=1 Tax=Streptomyces gobiensis TaxID=2875706 RepID=UPI001E5F225F|nr:zf-HC2 domain-containing protein [Streptomyces gobiensis]UGY93485.1 zf-HC2 domain-containing protein [Streptomyces gobiensis]